MGDFTQVSTDALRAGTTTIDSDLGTIHFDPSLPDGQYSLVEFRRGHFRLEKDMQISQVSAGRDLESNGFPPIHVLGERGQGSREVDGQDIGATFDRLEESCVRLAERDEPVLSHISSSLVADGIHADGSTHPTDAAPSPVRIRDGEWIEEER
jgi:hypothetical protein